MESCTEINLSNLPEKCKSLLSDIKDVIEAYPFMRDVISTYLSSLSSNKWLCKNIKNFPCVESSAENSTVNAKKKKIEICDTVTTKSNSQYCVAEEFLNESQKTDKKLCSKMPVVLLKRLCHTDFPLKYRQNNVDTSSVNCSVKSNIFSEKLKTNEELCTTTDYLDSSNSKVNDDILPNKKETVTRYVFGHLTSDVNESDMDRMMEEHSNKSEDSALNEDVDAISLYTNSISGSDLEDDPFPKSDAVYSANIDSLGNSNNDSVQIEHTDEGFGIEHTEGQTDHSDGQTNYIDRQTDHTGGQDDHTDGQDDHTDGQAGHTDGQAGHPDGQAGHPDGQAGHPDGQAGHPDGQSDHTDEGFGFENTDGQTHHTDEGFGFEHTDGQIDQSKVPINSVDNLLHENIHKGENGGESVCEQSSLQFPALKRFLRDRSLKTTFPRKWISLSNNNSYKSTRTFRKREPRTRGVIENNPKEWFSGYCYQILSTGLKCRPKTCQLSHERPEITSVQGEELIKVVTFAKENNFIHFLGYSFPKLIRFTAKAKNCKQSYDTLLKVLEINGYTGPEAIEYIMEGLLCVNGFKISEVFLDFLHGTILKCDSSANIWIKFIHLYQKKGYYVPMNVIIDVLHLCIVSSHRMLCETVFKEFFQPPKYDLKVFPCDLIRKFADTLLNLKLDGDFSVLDIREEATTKPLQHNSLSKVESHNSVHNATNGCNNEIVHSLDFILGPTRMKFCKEMSEYFVDDFCNIDSILPELVSVSQTPELHKYYHVLFMLKEDIKEKKFDNFIDIIHDLQKMKHYLEISRELYVIWKSVHGFNSQPFFDLISSVINRRNITEFIELILTTIGVNIMLEKYFKSSWSDAYAICKALLDKCLNPASAQVCHKKIISPCNVVLITCEVCMAVDDLKNAVKLIQENGFFAPSGWSVKTVEGDIIMRAEVCEKLLELLILRHLYSVASLMMWRLWNCQSVCFEPIDLRKFCPSLICGLLSQDMGSESEKLYVMTKNSVKYENTTIRLLVVDGLRRKKVFFAREVYDAGVSLKVYPAITVCKPVSTIILSSWTEEEIQIALMIFFDKVAEFFKNCEDVNDFNIVIYIKKVGVNSEPEWHHMLKNDSNCHFTKQKIEEILCTKLIRPISWTSSSPRAVYPDKNSVYLYVKEFFMQTLY